jgi:hypothetical protein
MTGQVKSLNRGQTVQCYIQDWGTGAGSRIDITRNITNSLFITTSSDRASTGTWSVLAGGVGGTIDSAGGLYTAPASLASSGYDTIKFTDASLGLSATAKIWINGAATPVM